MGVSTTAAGAFDRRRGARRLAHLARALAMVAIATGFAVAPGAGPGSGSPAAAAEPTVVGVLPFSYLDTSGEPRDQSAEHAARVERLMHDLTAEIAGDGAVKTFSVADVTACGQDSACILAKARDEGADVVVAGALQKISTMATQLWIGVFDVDTGRQIFHRNMTFRGDNDVAWERAAEFIARQIAEKALSAG